MNDQLTRMDQYIEFQRMVLSSLPRPSEIDEETLQYWIYGRRLRRFLRSVRIKESVSIEVIFSGRLDFQDQERTDNFYVIHPGQKVGDNENFTVERRCVVPSVIRDRQIFVLRISNMNVDFTFQDIIDILFENDYCPANMNRFMTLTSSQDASIFSFLSENVIYCLNTGKYEKKIPFVSSCRGDGVIRHDLFPWKFSDPIVGARFELEMGTINVVAVKNGVVT